jgi:putative CocE/NonD family hydrolase
MYDPRHPAPTIGGAVGLPGLVIGANVGPQDQSPLEARPDVLVYTSDPLTEALEVTGPLTFKLYAASSAPDTDFMVNLCDVNPDGTSRILANGAIRARYRNSFDQAELLEAGQVYEYTIDLVATSNLFKPGHCIRIDVTSSSFPFINPNANTGKPIGEDTEADLTAALQTIFHGVDRPSHIVLPVIPR